MDHSLFTYLYNSTNQHLCCYTKRLCFHSHHDSANWRSCQLNQSWRGFPAQKHILGQIQVKTSIALIIVTSLDFMFGFFLKQISAGVLVCAIFGSLLGRGECLIPGSAQPLFLLGFIQMTSLPFTVHP